MSDWVELAKMVREEAGFVPLLFALVAGGVAFLLTSSEDSSVAAPIAVALVVAGVVLLAAIGLKGIVVKARRLQADAAVRARADLEAEQAEKRSQRTAEAFRRTREAFAELPILEFTTLAARFLDDPDLRIGDVPAVVAETKGLAQRARTHNILDHVPVERYYTLTPNGASFLRSDFGRALTIAAKEFCREFRQVRRKVPEAAFFGRDAELRPGEPTTVGDLYHRAEGIMRARGGEH